MWYWNETLAMMSSQILNSCVIYSAMPTVFFLFLFLLFIFHCYPVLSRSTFHLVQCVFIYTSHRIIDRYFTRHNIGGISLFTYTHTGTEYHFQLFDTSHMYCIQLNLTTSWHFFCCCSSILRNSKQLSFFVYLYFYHFI